MPDTKENCWRFFIERVRRQLKVVLCFSPVGSTLRVRARKFPAIINATSIDWFHEWPPGALISVSQKFLSELECLPVRGISKAGIQGFTENALISLCT
jgi:dynein heavy chain